jgi:hypothetical protein
MAVVGELMDRQQPAALIERLMVVLTRRATAIITAASTHKVAALIEQDMGSPRAEASIEDMQCARLPRQAGIEKLMEVAMGQHRLRIVSCTSLVKVLAAVSGTMLTGILIPKTDLCCIADGTVDDTELSNSCMRQLED